MEVRRYLYAAGVRILPDSKRRSARKKAGAGIIHKDGKRPPESET